MGLIRIGNPRRHLDFATTNFMPCTVRMGSWLLLVDRCRTLRCQWVDLAFPRHCGGPAPSRSRGKWGPHLFIRSHLLCKILLPTFLESSHRGHTERCCHAEFHDSACTAGPREEFGAAASCALFGPFIFRDSSHLKLHSCVSCWIGGFNFGWA